MTSSAAVAAAAPVNGTERASSGSGICQKTTFTAPGGYYSAGSFYSVANAKATVQVAWCYSNGVVTSHHVSFQTTIGSSQGQVTKRASLNSTKSTLNVEVTGTFSTGILNDVGIIDLVGTVNGTGDTSFANAASAGG